MPTITLMQNARSHAQIHRMTAQPGAIILTGLTGENSVFQCTNVLNTIQNATTVDIVYDATVNPPHQAIAVSSVIA
jgi:hypothetical protein